MTPDTINFFWDGKLRQMKRDEAIKLMGVITEQIVSQRSLFEYAMVVHVVSEYFGFQIEDITGRRRTEKLAWARQIAMFLCREFPNRSLTDVGNYFKRDHGTVMFACNKVVDRMSVYPNVREEMSRIREQLRSFQNETVAT